MNRRLSFIVFYAFFAGFQLAVLADRLDEGRSVWLPLFMIAASAWLVFDNWNEIKPKEALR